MSEPIRNKKTDPLAGAPTPQNTPLNNAPISSHAVDPKVATIHEVDDRALAANMLATNPALVSMIEGKLGSLIGRSSGYIEGLPAAVKQRITGLKGIQKEHSKLEAEFQEEVLQLEKKYLAKFTPLYEKRSKVVNGEQEPTEEEIKAGEELEDDDEEQPDESEKDEEKDDGADIKGVPEFWLSAMKNSTSLSETITERDEGALKSLKDIRMEYLEQPGFRLIFDFSENEFFTNNTITKTYFYKDESGYGGDFIYDHAEGDKIEWKPGKDLTVRIESKKQRNKNTKQTRVIKKTVPTDSFFNFFTPPKALTEEDDDAASDIEERLELDYQLGEDIKEKLIPRAIDWFTGDALQFEEFEDIDDLEDDDDDEDDISDDDRDDDDEESEEEDDNGKPKQQEAAECKQS